MPVAVAVPPQEEGRVMVPDDPGEIDLGAEEEADGEEQEEALREEPQAN